MAAELFSGFRSGSRATVVPNAFFTNLLPQISEPAELIVSFYVFFALGQQRGNPRAVTRRCLEGERPLMQALAGLPSGAEAALQRGISLAVARGTLLSAMTPSAGDEIYLLNTDSARQHLAGSGLLSPADDSDLEGTAVAPPRLNIYALYEDNIGLLPPLLIDELEEAERAFPSAWIEAAFREAIANNHRSWRYIIRILERWKIEGPDYEAPGRRAAFSSSGRHRTIGGPYRRVIERHGPDSE